MTNSIKSFRTVQEGNENVRIMLGKMVDRSFERKKCVCRTSFPFKTELKTDRFKERRHFGIKGKFKKLRKQATKSNSSIIVWIRDITLAIFDDWRDGTTQEVIDYNAMLYHCIE